MWTDFLALSDNKKDLSAILSDELLSLAPPEKVMVVAGGLGLEVKANDPQMDTANLRSDHEEADTCVILHCFSSLARHIVVSAHDTKLLFFCW